MKIPAVFLMLTLVACASGAQTIPMQTAATRSPQCSYLNSQPASRVKTQDYCTDPGPVVTCPFLCYDYNPTYDSGVRCEYSGFSYYALDNSCLRYVGAVTGGCDASTLWGCSTTLECKKDYNADRAVAPKLASAIYVVSGETAEVASYLLGSAAIVAWLRSEGVTSAVLGGTSLTVRGWEIVVGDSSGMSKTTANTIIGQAIARNGDEITNRCINEPWTPTERARTL